MTRTINGKTLKEVMEELQKPFGKEWKDYEQNKYIPIEEVEQRLEDVLGLNYSFNLTQPLTLLELEEITKGTGERVVNRSFVGAGEICIYDDEGKFVSRRSAGNGTNLIKVTKTGLSKDMTNDYNSAISLIKKKCAMGFGIGRYLVFEKNSNKGTPIQGTGKSQNPSNTQPSSKPQGNSQASVSQSNSTSESSNVTKLKLRSKANTNNATIKFNVVDNTGREGELVIFKNSNLAKNEVKMKKLYALPVDTVIKVALTKEGDYNGTPQFICNDVAV